MKLFIIGSVTTIVLLSVIGIVANVYMNAYTKTIDCTVTICK